MNRQRQREREIQRQRERQQNNDMMTERENYFFITAGVVKFYPGYFFGSGYFERTVSRPVYREINLIECQNIIMSFGQYRQM